MCYSLRSVRLVKIVRVVGFGLRTARIARPECGEGHCEAIIWREADCNCPRPWMGTGDMLANLFCILKFVRNAGIVGIVRLGLRLAGIVRRACGEGWIVIVPGPWMRTRTMLAVFVVWYVVVRIVRIV